LALEDLSRYITFCEICDKGLEKSQALLLARNCAKALAELHSIGIVHGDFASENILVDADVLDVKVIDFDITSKVGSYILAGGNPDFITEEMALAVTKHRFKVESQFQTDLYALALCCFLILGDQ
jgi:serine/threonine protein kinase